VFEGLFVTSIPSPKQLSYFMRRRLRHPESSQLAKGITSTGQFQVRNGLFLER